MSGKTWLKDPIILTLAVLLEKRHTDHVSWVDTQTAFLMHYFLEQKENWEEDTVCPIKGGLSLRATL